MGLAVDQLDEGQAAQLRPVDAVLQQLQHLLPRRACALLALLGLRHCLRACVVLLIKAALLASVAKVVPGPRQLGNVTQLSARAGHFRGTHLEHQLTNNDVTQGDGRDGAQPLRGLCVHTRRATCQGEHPHDKAGRA